MRKVFIIALGLVSLGALSAAQPAFAELKTVCRWRVTGAYVGNFKPGPLGIGVWGCHHVDGPPTPTTPWKGTTDYSKTFSSSTRTHQK